MKRLVDNGDLAEDQYKDLTTRLRQEHILIRETHTNFLDFGAIWVMDDDFQRAREILRTESASFAGKARAKWEEQWRTEYRSSWVRWFAYRLFRSPAGTLVRLLLLVLMVGLFAIYPLSYVFR